METHHPHPLPLHQSLDQNDDQNFFSFSVPPSRNANADGSASDLSFLNSSNNSNNNSLIIIPNSSSSINAQPINSHPHQIQNNAHNFSFSLPPPPTASSTSSSLIPITKLTPTSSSSPAKGLHTFQLPASIDHVNNNDSAHQNLSIQQSILSNSHQPSPVSQPDIANNPIFKLNNDQATRQSSTLRPQTSALATSSSPLTGGAFNAANPSRPYGRMSYPSVVYNNRHQSINNNPLIQPSTNSHLSNPRQAQTSLPLSSNFLFNSTNPLGVRPMTAPGPGWPSSGDCDYQLTNSDIFGSLAGNSAQSNPLQLIDRASSSEIFGPPSGPLNGSPSPPEHSSRATTSSSHQIQAAIGSFTNLSTATQASTAPSSLSSSPPSSSPSSSSLPPVQEQPDASFHSNPQKLRPASIQATAANNTSASPLTSLHAIESPLGGSGSQFQFSYEKLMQSSSLTSGSSSASTLVSRPPSQTPTSAYLQSITNQQNLIRPNTHAGTMIGFGSSEDYRASFQNGSAHHYLGYQPASTAEQQSLRDYSTTPSYHHLPIYSTHRPLSSSQAPPGALSFGPYSHARPMGDHHHQFGIGSERLYNFNILPGAPRKRARRRFDEVERLYDCNYPGCTKAYGTLNHLNAHITMQKHGPKRLPQEFKEIRKEWRARKKAEAEARTSNKKFKSEQPSSDFQARFPLAERDGIHEGNIRPHTAIGGSGDRTMSIYQSYPRLPGQLMTKERDGNEKIITGPAGIDEEVIDHHQGFDQGSQGDDGEDDEGDDDQDHEHDENENNYNLSKVGECKIGVLES